MKNHSLPFCPRRLRPFILSRKINCSLSVHGAGNSTLLKECGQCFTVSDFYWFSREAVLHKPQFPSAIEGARAAESSPVLRSAPLARRTMNRSVTVPGASAGACVFILLEKYISHFKRCISVIEHHACSCEHTTRVRLRLSINPRLSSPRPSGDAILRRALFVLRQRKIPLPRPCPARLCRSSGRPVGQA